MHMHILRHTYNELDDGFCGAVTVVVVAVAVGDTAAAAAAAGAGAAATGAEAAVVVVVVELRAFFFSVLAFLLVLGTLVDFFDSLALLLEALLFDCCLESFDLDVDEFSMTTCPVTVDNELFV